ncbi:hypothetical protein [Streptomyces sp. NRRL F-2747]|uniref:hypothetical protein n=1 Tax=Streptomyces sp. NRRL F-2747 TaxID=1463843 RepID=UPI000ABB58E7|nr:hypothetical protein [Streptomyces sp. NRRL F-2747]
MDRIEAVDQSYNPQAEAATAAAIAAANVAAAAAEAAAEAAARLREQIAGGVG